MMIISLDIIIHKIIKIDKYFSFSCCSSFTSHMKKKRIPLLFSYHLIDHQHHQNDGVVVLEALESFDESSLELLSNVPS